ncbi:unnamed protein product [Nezara viridula]|uniref:Neuropeptide n=1 Tax=Nezara viridula TaxID=85310 RepID=A0A9P0H2Z5_NEZVI|nr:unnamed protein product [Nezara viridula]
MKTLVATFILFFMMLQLGAYLTIADASVMRESTQIRWDKLERPDVVRSVLQYHQKKTIDKKEEKNINIRIFGGKR